MRGRAGSWWPVVFRGVDLFPDVVPVGGVEGEHQSGIAGWAHSVCGGGVGTTIMLGFGAGP